MADRALTDEQVRLILTVPHKSCQEWADELGTTHATITRVRAGHVYKLIWREVYEAGTMCSPEEMAPRFLTRPRARRLSSETAREIITSQAPIRAWMKRLGLTRSVIERIRAGITYRDVYAAVQAEQSRPRTTSKCDFEAMRLVA